MLIWPGVKKRVPPRPQLDCKVLAEACKSWQLVWCEEVFQHTLAHGSLDDAWMYISQSVSLFLCSFFSSLVS